MLLKTHPEVFTNDLVSLWLIILWYLVPGFQLHKYLLHNAIPTFLSERPVVSNGFFVIDSIVVIHVWLLLVFFGLVAPCNSFLLLVLTIQYIHSNTLYSHSSLLQKSVLVLILACRSAECLLWGVTTH
jgi:hypothetical protein